MDHISKRTIVETIQTANEYISELACLVKAVGEAENQVRNSSQDTISQIDEKFDIIKTTFINLLDTRRSNLKSRVEELEKQGLKPLAECKNEITANIMKTKVFIEELQGVLKVGGLPEERNYKFFEDASALGSLPAVPDLELVPHITLNCSIDHLLKEMECNITRLGHVSKMGVTQICLIEEKPGALLVHWEQVDFDVHSDVLDFRLQMAYGDLTTKEQLQETNFHDVYSGPETEFLVRDLKHNLPYSFRVCCKGDIDRDWSAWSLMKVSKTTSPPFCWDINSDDYVISNEGKLARKKTSEFSILFSKGAQIFSGHSIEFIFLDCPDQGMTDEGIGLVVNSKVLNLVDTNVFFCSFDGTIYVNGVRNLTQLPHMKKGVKLTFSCEKIDDNRWRVSVDTCDKVVTYDWKISASNIYFAALFIQPGFKIFVS